MALVGEGSLVADACDEVAREITVGSGRGLYGGDDRGIHFSAAWSEADRLAGGTEGYFP